MVPSDSLCTQVDNASVDPLAILFRLAVAFLSFFFASYLHQNKIIHGNVSLATIFIQHNGLVKIGSGMYVSSVSYNYYKLHSTVQ